MAIKCIETIEKGILEVHATDHFTEKDYTQLDEATDRLLAHAPCIRVLLLLQDFHGWETESLWERRKVIFKHGQKLERMAVVGSESLRELMLSMRHAWQNSEVLFFTDNEELEARNWIENRSDKA